MDIFSTFGPTSRMEKPFAKMIPYESRPERVGPRVTAMRMALGQSKATFADSILLDRSSLTKIEKGEAGLDIKMAERIFRVYGFGLNYLYANELSDVPRSLHADVLKNLADMGG